MTLHLERIVERWPWRATVRVEYKAEPAMVRTHMDSTPPKAELEEWTWRVVKMHPLKGGAYYNPLEMAMAQATLELEEGFEHQVVEWIYQDMEGVTE